MKYLGVAVLGVGVLGVAVLGTAVLGTAVLGVAVLGTAVLQPQTRSLPAQHSSTRSSHRASQTMSRIGT
jgi:hypothetical protein